MVQITYPGTNNFSTMAYDGLGRCVKIVEVIGGTTNSTTQFIWCGNDRCEARDGSSAVTAQYFSRGETISGGSYYLTTDHLGSVRELTNNAGTIVWQQSFDPYGVPTTIVSTAAADFGYAGYYLHSRSGLNSTLHRFYSPQLGRWLSRDPIADPTFSIFATMDPSPTRSPEPETAHSIFPMLTFMPTSILMLSNDSLLRTALLRALPMSAKPAVHTAEVLEPNQYAYVLNSPMGSTDPTGLDGGPICAWPDDWFFCAAKCAARCAIVKNKGYCFKECYRDCTHGMDP